MRVPPKWEQHWGECEECGDKIWMTSPAKKFCDACKRNHKLVTERQRMRGAFLTRSREYRAEQKARRLKMQAYLEQSRKERERHICRFAGSCIYGAGSGGTRWCNYATIEGKLRTLNGQHLIIDGKCDLYEKGQHIADKHLKL